ncbi:LysR family transcriptional regulator [Burkholderia sp. Ac-20379]|nr:LysR family transcriptional regulator [Burkholderia sp. Ac-20379]MBN3726975.1 LysR family transcriptional regulator [Burkholderia sp. Ac-20379]
MQAFDLEQLRTLVAAVEAGSLAGAAPTLHRSQSAVSEQLKKLEEFAGVALLQRGKKGVRPTAAGERLVVHARAMLAASDRALDDMRGMSLAGELRLAITDYFRPAAVPQLLRGLRKRYPKLRLHVSIVKSMQIERDAQSGDFDIGLGMRIAGPDNSSVGQPLRREALTWVATRDFEHEPGSPLPLVALPPDCALQRSVRQTLDQHGVPYVVAHSASGIAGLQSALEAGLGVACLNASAVPPQAVDYPIGRDLPGLPDIEFFLLPPRPGETELMSEVRNLLVTQFA